MPGSFTSNSAPKFSQNEFDSHYTHYTAVVSFETDLGRIVLPVSPQGSTPVPSEIVQVRQPTTVKVVAWTAERMGAHPINPNPYSSDPNLVLLNTRISPANRVLGADGVQVFYRVEGAYRYACRQAILPGQSSNPMYYPNADYDIATTGDNQITAADFGDNIIL